MLGEAVIGGTELLHFIRVAGGKIVLCVLHHVPVARIFWSVRPVKRPSSTKLPDQKAGRQNVAFTAPDFST